MAILHGKVCYVIKTDPLTIRTFTHRKNLPFRLALHGLRMLTCVDMILFADALWFLFTEHGDYIIRHLFHSELYWMLARNRSVSG